MDGEAADLPRRNSGEVVTTRCTVLLVEVNYHRLTIEGVNDGHS